MVPFPGHNESNFEDEEKNPRHDSRRELNSVENGDVDNQTRDEEIFYEVISSEETRFLDNAHGNSFTEIPENLFNPLGYVNETRGAVADAGENGSNHGSRNDNEEKETFAYGDEVARRMQQLNLESEGAGVEEPGIEEPEIGNFSGFLHPTRTCSISSSHINPITSTVTGTTAGEVLSVNNANDSVPSHFRNNSSNNSINNNNSNNDNNNSDTNNGYDNNISCMRTYQQNNTFQENQEQAVNSLGASATDIEHPAPLSNARNDLQRDRTRIRESRTSRRGIDIYRIYRRILRVIDRHRARDRSRDRSSTNVQEENANTYINIIDQTLEQLMHLCCELQDLSRQLALIESGESTRVCDERDHTHSNGDVEQGNERRDDPSEPRRECLSHDISSLCSNIESELGMIRDTYRRQEIMIRNAYRRQEIMRRMQRERRRMQRERRRRRETRRRTGTETRRRTGTETRRSDNVINSLMRRRLDLGTNLLNATETVITRFFRRQVVREIEQIEASRGISDLRESDRIPFTETRGNSIERSSTDSTEA